METINKLIKIDEDSEIINKLIKIESELIIINNFVKLVKNCLESQDHQKLELLNLMISTQFYGK